MLGCIHVVFQIKRDSQHIVIEANHILSLCQLEEYKQTMFPCRWNLLGSFQQLRMLDDINFCHEMSWGMYNERILLKIV